MPTKLKRCLFILILFCFFLIATNVHAGFFDFGFWLENYEDELDGWSPGLHPVGTPAYANGGFHLMTEKGGYREAVIPSDPARYYDDGGVGTFISYNASGPGSQQQIWELSTSFPTNPHEMVGSFYVYTEYPPGADPYDHLFGVSKYGGKFMSYNEDFGILFEYVANYPSWKCCYRYVFGIDDSTNLGAAWPIGRPYVFDSVNTDACAIGTAEFVGDDNNSGPGLYKISWISLDPESPGGGILTNVFPLPDGLIPHEGVTQCGSFLYGLAMGYGAQIFVYRVDLDFDPLSYSAIAVPDITYYGPIGPPVTDGTNIYFSTVFGYVYKLDTNTLTITKLLDDNDNVFFIGSQLTYSDGYLYGANSYAILKYHLASGTLQKFRDNVSGTSPSNGVALSPNGSGYFLVAKKYGGTDHAGQIGAIVPGDYNSDGYVDIADYTLWSDNYGQTGSNPADGNCDNVVDLADYTLWSDNYGRGIPLE